MPILNTTAQNMVGGLDAVVGTGQDFRFTFAGAWATGTTWSVVFTDNLTATQELVGSGDVTGKVPTFAFTYGNKVHVLAGSTDYFSDTALPTSFNSLEGAGNGFVTMWNYYSTPEPLVAIAPYQGRLAFFARNTTQIWQTPADPANWAQVQVLQNIGTFAPASVQPLGDLDVFFLADTGVRSLRVRDSSNNAFVNDVGSAIDQLIQNALLGLAPATAAAACGVVEPTSNRYWLFLNGVIYVFSYFPSSKVLAWTTYDASFISAGTTFTFTPTKWLVYNGQVYCIATVDATGDSAVFLYGGVGNNVYDATLATVQLPFLDAKTPATNKTSRGIDMAITGSWTVSGSMDEIGKAYVEIATDSEATFNKGMVGWSAGGTHFSLKATTTAASKAVLSSLIFHYDANNEK